MLKFSELMHFTDKELQKILIDTTAKVNELRLDNAVKSVDNPHELRNLRKDKARVLTAIRLKNIAAQVESSKESKGVK